MLRGAPHPVRRHRSREPYLADSRYHSRLVYAAGNCLGWRRVEDDLGAPRVHVLLGDRPPQSLADIMHTDWVHFITDGSCGWPITPQPAGAEVYNEYPTTTRPRTGWRSSSAGHPFDQDSESGVGE